MNQPGEIQRLCEISHPTAGMVTTISEGHSQFFDSIDAIAQTKFALYESLPPEGITFLNMNDPRIAQFPPKTTRTVTYGLDAQADISGKILAVDAYSRVTLQIEDMGNIELKVPGSFQAINALAAAAVGRAYGVFPALICDSLQDFQGVPGRAQLIETDQYMILNDSYNANPVSMQAALDILASLPTRNRRVAILGDMLELNSTREEKHRMIGSYAVSKEIDIIIGVGPLSESIIDEARSQNRNTTFHFHESEECADNLPSILQHGDTVLLKGSHAIHLERLLEVL